jgi:hypothetical protein
MASSKEPKHCLAIIPEGELAAMKNKGPVQDIFGGPGRTFFEVELVPVGGPDDAPATHYWAAGQTTNAKYNAFIGIVQVHPGAKFFEYDPITNPSFQWETLEAEGLKERKLSPHP